MTNFFAVYRYHMYVRQFCTKYLKTTFNHTWKGEIYNSVSDSSHSREVCSILRKHLQFKIHSIHKQHNRSILKAQLCYIMLTKL